MFRRPLLLPCAALLLVGLAALPACKKKSTNTDGDSPVPGSGPSGTPPVVSGPSDYVLFAHLKAKDVFNSAIFAEVKAAVEKAGATDDWNKFEADALKEIGIKPTDIDSVTIAVTEVPNPKGPNPGDMPKLIVIVAANKPIDKASAFKLGPDAKPDNRGFYTSRDTALVHFPDAQTMAVLHPALAQRYLDGYAKNRSGWPMTAEHSKAAAGHSLYAVARLDKVPNELTREVPLPQVKPLLAAKTVVVTGDLKGKEVRLGVRASFPDAASAGKAKESVTQLVEMASGLIEVFASGKEAKEYSGFMPAVKEAQRALKEARVEVAGSDLVVTGSYQANFDIGTMVVEAVKKIQDASGRMTAQNNLKQVMLALHNFESAMGKVVIHGAGPNGVPLKNANEKPLMSWRVAILPFIEQDNLYKQFRLNEPWDSEHNKKLIPQMPKVFAPVGAPGKPGYTHLQMVIGPNAMQLPSATIAGITDGTSNTIAIVEAAEPVIWTKPDDVMLPGNVLPKDLKKKFGGLQPGGFNVAMWDGSVRFIRDTINDRTLGLLLNPRDGQAIPNDW